MPRILFITQHPPFPPRSGDRQRSFLIAKSLSQIGQLNMILIDPGNKFFPDQLQYIRDHFGLLDTATLTPAANHGPLKAIRKFAPVQIDRLATGIIPKQTFYRSDPQVAPIIAKHAAGGKFDLLVGRYLRPAVNAGISDFPPSILDLDDLDTQVLASRLESGRLPLGQQLLTRWHLRQLQKFIPPMLRRFDHLWTASPVDLPLIDHPSVSVLPNIPFDSDLMNPPAPPAPEPQSKIILVVATMRAAMNLAGIEYFLAHVWPKVYAAVPAARFRICGTGLNDQLKQKWSVIPGVQPVGSVDDLTEEYRQAALAVAPVYEGGGTKIKVVESLHRGRVPLITPEALRGYEHVLKHGESVWVAENDFAMVDGCVHLLNDPALRQRLAGAGHAIVSREFSFSTFSSRIARSVEDVLRRAR